MARTHKIYANADKYIRVYAPFIIKKNEGLRIIDPNDKTSFGAPRTKIYGHTQYSNGVYMLNTSGWQEKPGFSLEELNKRIPLLGCRWYFSHKDLAALGVAVEEILMRSSAYSEYLLLSSFGPENLSQEWQRWAKFGHIFVYNSELATYYNSKSWVKVNLPTPDRSQEELEKQFERSVGTSSSVMTIYDDMHEPEIPF